MEYKIREKLFGANRTSASGTSLTLNDTVKYPINKLTIDGVCEQDTTSGSNLCNLNVVQDSRVVYNSDGTITINGAGGFALKFSDYTFKANTTYYMKWELISGSVNQEQIFMAPDNTSFAKKDTFAPFKFDSDTVIRGLWIHGGALFTNAVIRIWFSETQNSFEPYTGGQPSPNPDYPQEIKTIENSLKITSCNKNLLDDTKLAITSGSGNGSKKIDSEGKITSIDPIYDNRGYGYKHCDYFFTLGKGSYYLYYEIFTPTSNVNAYMNIYNENNRIYVSNFANKTGVISTKFTLEDFSNIGIEFKLYEGKIRLWILKDEAQDKSYEQHLETQITANLPEGEFIAKINDTYKDTLNIVYKNDGHYHLILNKMVGKVVLNGSEKYTNSGISSNNFIYMMKTIINDIKSAANDEEFVPVMSNYFSNGFSYTSLGYSIAGTNGITIAQNNTLTICHSGYTKENTEGFKNWLSTHNVEVYYALATSYEVDLGIVDTLLSYDEITNIFTDSDLQPVINVKYYNGSLDISNYEFSIKEV